MVKKPPSRVKYERSHPMVSARLDKETYDKLQEMVKSEGKSLAGFLKDFVKKGRSEWEGAYERGYEEGKDDHIVWYYCDECGGRLYMMPGEEDHEAMIKYMKEEGWGHRKCPEE